MDRRPSTVAADACLTDVCGADVWGLAVASTARPSAAEPSGTADTLRRATARGRLAGSPRGPVAAAAFVPAGRPIRLDR